MSHCLPSRSPLLGHCSGWWNPSPQEPRNDDFHKPMIQLVTWLLLGTSYLDPCQLIPPIDHCIRNSCSQFCEIQSNSKFLWLVVQERGLEFSKNFHEWPIYGATLSERFAENQYFNCYRSKNSHRNNKTKVECWQIVTTVLKTIPIVYSNNSCSAI